jgi:hypothetical protein
MSLEMGTAAVKAIEAVQQALPPGTFGRAIPGIGTGLRGAYTVPAPKYRGVATERGVKEFRWSGAHNESMPLATAVS